MTPSQVKRNMTAKIKDMDLDVSLERKMNLIIEEVYQVMKNEFIAVGKYNNLLNGRRTADGVIKALCMELNKYRQIQHRLKKSKFYMDVVNQDEEILA